MTEQLTPLISVNNVSFRYNEEDDFLLKDLSFTIYKNEILGIVGENGTGKSTLFSLLNLDLSPTSGEIVYENPELEMAQLLQKNNFNFNIPLTVEDFFLYFVPQKTNWGQEEILEILQLTKTKKQKLSDLSFGQKRRLFMARTLLTSKADIYLFDEPLTGIDRAGQDQFLELITILKEKFGKTIIFIEHNLSALLRQSDRVLCLGPKVHWHPKKDFTQKILPHLYSCDYEHILLHEKL